ncbi:MAG: hypothetical protein JXA14_25895 [Anaerolineae bacterium]|nr:hypothetical protein [Anaerolineae bacterium]
MNPRSRHRDRQGIGRTGVGSRRDPGCRKSAGRWLSIYTHRQSVHGSRWLTEAIDFPESNQAALNRAPVAFFSVCLSGLAKDETALASARDTVFGPLRDFVAPVAEVLFAGKVDRRGVALGLPRWLARFFPTLDFRNWTKIRGWAQELSIPRKET